MRGSLRRYSSHASPAAKILQRQKSGAFKKEAGSAPDLLTKAESSLPAPPSAATSQSTFGFFGDGMVNLWGHSSRAIDLWTAWKARNERLERRTAIRNYLRTKQDLLVVLPGAVVSVLPLSFVFSTVPGLIPAAFCSPSVIDIKIRATQKKREEYASKVVDAVTKQVDSLNEGLVLQKTTHDAALLFKKMMLTTASISFSDLNELLYPLFISRLTAGNGLANPSIFTGFLHHTFPFVFPRTRLIQWADWILKDDAIIRREGVQSMTRLELLEALEERGFTALQDVSVEEMKSTLLSHTKWTKLAFDTIVNKRNWEKGVDVNSEAIVVPKVSRDLGLTSEELGGVAALLVVARALNVRV